ncbi:MAG: SRPBCC domain-containing protein, partial [Bradyrhizobium sp.]
MNIDHFKPMTVYTIYIASTPQKVWEALTSTEFSRKYFFGNAVEIDLKIGGAYIVRTPDGAVHIMGEVVECDRPRKLTVTFNVNWPELIEKLGTTLVTYEIEPTGDAVRLTMTESHDR